ncbi:hypothetical protein RRG08_044365 [Elysia crispata]|uniref:Uncharacterized protein n=1 Tax=Elysia crispata TaxID=231223 RepID=A0AAE1DV09_9GAST|nr:hypothetical protein RRG08_044365 [Elysia crispata]
MSKLSMVAPQRYRVSYDTDRSAAEKLVVMDGLNVRTYRCSIRAASFPGRDRYRRQGTASKQSQAEATQDVGACFAHNRI